jgi:hypothetical protein
MCFGIYEKFEGLPDVEAHAYILVDGSGTMGEKELLSGELKHRRCAWMVQQLLNAMDSPQYEYAFITVVIFSADREGVKVVSLLEGHNPCQSKMYTGNTDLDIWDGLSPQNRAQGMGNQTPIGTAIAWAREQAEQWVNASTGQVKRRAVIYLLSDGMNTYGPSGLEEKKAIQAFNSSSERGGIRLATIGYFQSKEGDGTRPEEDAGRRLLRDLVLNDKAYFEAGNVHEIVRYILSTLTQAMKQVA